jgi:hypothetical protein
MLRRQVAGNGKEKIGSRNLPQWLAFVAVGALLGIKFIGRDTEHVIALDTDAVDDGAYDHSGLERLVQIRWMRISCLFRCGLSRHGQILACGRPATKENRRHPRDVKDASLSKGNEEFRLSCNRAQAAKVYGESRTALARMKYFGAYQTGAQQAMDK